MFFLSAKRFIFEAQAMKKKYLFSFITLFALCVFFFSCSKPSCPDTKCYNGGLREGGGSNCGCVCQRGYVGNNCDTEFRYAFLGNYSAQCYDNNGFGCGAFTLVIGTSTDSVTAINIGLNTVTLKATVDPDNSNVSIPYQTISGTTFLGSGVFQSGTIALTLNSAAGNVTTVTYYQGPKL